MMVLNGSTIGASASSCWPAHLLCLVPHCRRTTRADRLPEWILARGPEWICGKHWPLVSPAWRRRYALVKRRRRYDLAARSRRG